MGVLQLFCDVLYFRKKKRDIIHLSKYIYTGVITLVKNMKKIIAALTLSIMAVGVTACTPKANPNADRLDKIKSTKVLRLGTEATYPPMEFTDEKGNKIGFDIEMINHIAEKLGAKMEIITTDFAGITEGLSADRFDVIAATMNITPEREKIVLFSKPYIEAVGLSVIVKSGNTDIKSFADLSDKVIGIQQGTTSEDYVKDKQYKEIKKYIKIADGLLDLKAGRVDAVITDNVVGAYYMKVDAASYVMLDELAEAGPVGIAIPMNSPQLKAEVDKVLDEMMKDGTFTELSMKWFGKDIYKK